MLRQPLAEVFGFPVDNDGVEAERHRQHRLCPFNNKVPNCTKDSVTHPLGICSIFHGNELAIVCPVRLRQSWVLTEHAASFFFPPGTNWTTLLEVRLKDKHGRSAGNIDLVIVAYNKQGDIIDYGGLQVQVPSFSARSKEALFGSIAPQTFFGGAVLKSWGKKQAIALQRYFYDTLPELPTTEPADSDMAWFIYDLQYEAADDRYSIRLHKTVHTKFVLVMELLASDDIHWPEAGSEQEFVDYLYAAIEKAVVN